MQVEELKGDIQQLLKKIQKMKNCSNCKYFEDDEFCKLDGRENYCRWELKEDD